MKIVIIAPVYPYRGGPSIFTSFLYESLSKKFGVKIYNYKLLYPSILFPGKTQYDVSGKVAKKVPNERHVNSINPFNWIATAKKLKQENADLVVFDWWHPFFAFCHYSISLLLKKRYRGRILFITENVVSHENNFIDKFLTKWGLRNADRFLVLSDAVKKDLAVFAKGKPVYESELPQWDCYELHEAAKEDFGFKKHHNILLFFGYVRSYKGLDVLLEAMPAILKKDPDVRLLVAGEFYDKYEKYDAIIKRLNIGDKVKMVNEFVSNEELGKYFYVADLIVLPYRSATQSAVMNMTFSFLKPVLATDVGGLAEFIDEGKTGYVVEPNNPAAIAGGVAKFYDDKGSVDFAANIQARNKDVDYTEVFTEMLNSVEDK